MGLIKDVSWTPLKSKIALLLLCALLSIPIANGVFRKTLPLNLAGIALIQALVGGEVEGGAYGALECKGGECEHLLDESEAWISFAQSHDSANARIDRFKSFIYTLRGQDGLAQDAFQRALSVDPSLKGWGPADYYLRSASKSQKQGYLLVALSYILRAADLESQNVAILTKAGDIYAELQRWEEAATFYRNVLRFEPSSVKARIGLASVLHKGQRNDSEQDRLLDESIKLEPQRAYDIYVLRGQWAKDDRKYDLAEKFYKQAIAVNSRSEFAPMYLGILYRDLGRLDDSLSEFQQALEINKTNYDTQYVMGDLYLRMGKPDQALPYFLMASGRPGRFPMYHLGLAEAYRSIGETVLAISEYRKVLELDPTNSYAADQLNKLSR